MHTTPVCKQLFPIFKFCDSIPVYIWEFPDAYGDSSSAYGSLFFVSHHYWNESPIRELIFSLMPRLVPSLFAECSCPSLS